MPIAETGGPQFDQFPTTDGSFCLYWPPITSFVAAGNNSTAHDPNACDTNLDFTAEY